MRFGRLTYEKSDQGYHQIETNSIVPTYKSQSQELSSGLKGLFEHCKLSCFVSVVKDEIFVACLSAQSHDLNSVFDVLKIQEEYVNNFRKRTFYRRHRYSAFNEN